MTNRTALKDLHQQIVSINEMQEYVPGLIKSARMAGASWTQIGDALGISRQAAQKRWSHIDSELDPFGTRPIDV